MVLCGHTHEPRIKTVYGVLVINPGSAHGFETKAMMAILDTKTKKAEIFELV